MCRAGRYQFKRREVAPVDRKNPPLKNQGWGILKYVCPGSLTIHPLRITDIRLLLGGGEAVVADAANFGTRDGDLDVAVAGNLLFQLFVEAGFEFADLAAAKAGDMDVVAGAVSFVIVAVGAEVE